MAFTIQESGTREGVLKHLESLTVESPHGTDRAQIQAVKELVAKEIAALPESSTGVRVDIHTTANETMRQIHINVIPRNIRA